MPIKLSNRLGAIAGYIEDGAAVADIGSDHGYLPAYLAANGLARRIFASDISERSLSSARRTAEKYRVAEAITFVTTPGLSGFEFADIDTIIIAGMGGETISGILADAPWLKERSAKLILQPQTKAVKLCLWLSDNGYAIRDSKYARDRGRRYVIIVCQSNGVNGAEPILKNSSAQF